MYYLQPFKAQSFQHTARLPIYLSVESPLFYFFRGRVEESAPLKLPTRYCPVAFFPRRLEHTFSKNGIPLMTPRYPKVRFKVSRLCYACKKYDQYQAAVKLLGSFRLTTGSRHLYRHCIFTEQILETVAHSLRHSCTSELHFFNPLLLEA